MLALQTIARPLHQHNARTPEEYRQKQAAFIARGRLKRPYLNWRDPVVVPDQVAAFVSGGCWVVLCPCGNAPAADPEWRLACCFECGAIYEGVSFPDSWQDVEAVLVARPKMHQRNANPSERLSVLASENVAHGHAVSASVTSMLMAEAAAEEEAESFQSSDGRATEDDGVVIKPEEIR